jgi:hypothetical protein
MRQTLLLLAIAVGSPLAMAQDPVGATTSSVIGAEASRQPTTGVAAPPTASPQDHAKPAPKPVSAIGRALAELMQDANRKRSQAASQHDHKPTAAAGPPRDGDAAPPTQLVAQDEPGGGS